MEAMMDDREGPTTFDTASSAPGDRSKRHIPTLDGIAVGRLREYLDHAQDRQDQDEAGLEEEAPVWRRGGALGEAEALYGEGDWRGASVKLLERWDGEHRFTLRPRGSRE
jgi:hypothetical protein